MIRNCVFSNNEALAGSAVYCTGMIGLLFENNTVVGNRCETAAVVVRSRTPEATIQQNIFADNSAYGLWTAGHLHFTTVYCNAFWQNNTIGVGSWYEREEGQWRADSADGYEGAEDWHNVLADPMLCDDFTVSDGSPLAQQDFPCEPIGGARGFGCAHPPILETSWGKLKTILGK